MRNLTLYLATASLVVAALLLPVTPAAAVTNTAAAQGTRWQADDEPVVPAPEPEATAPTPEQPAEVAPTPEPSVPDAPLAPVSEPDSTTILPEPAAEVALTPEPSVPDTPVAPVSEPEVTTLPPEQPSEVAVTPPAPVPDVPVAPVSEPEVTTLPPEQPAEVVLAPEPSVPDAPVAPVSEPDVTTVTTPTAPESVTLATTGTHHTAGRTSRWQDEDAPLTPPPSAPEPPDSSAPDASAPDASAPSGTFSQHHPPSFPPADPDASHSPSSHHRPPGVYPYSHYPYYPYYYNYPYNNYPYYTDPYVWPYPYARWSPYVGTYSSAVVVETPQPAPVYNPVISSFTANPSYIQPGQSALLTWTVNDASNVTISPSVGSVPNSGVYTVMPAYTTTYTLTASGTGGSVTASTTVTVAQYYSTYGTDSSVSPATSIATPTGTDGVATSGVSAGSSPALNLWLLYALLIGLLAVGAGVIVTLLVRKPAKAYAGIGSGTRAGYLSSSTAPAATLTASGAPMTTPLAAGQSARFTAEGGKDISLNAAGQSSGRTDLHSLAVPGKADLISRQHFSLSHENGEYYIEDRGSTNGTRLNGSEIRGKGKQLLKDGDKVDLAGALTITFKS